MGKIKVSAVSYLNTKPFLYGLEHSDIINEIELSLDIPSVCAKKLLNGETDLGLIPVAIIPELTQTFSPGERASMISDYCIGSDGAVKTVCIYSHVPIEQVKNIYLDYQSRTSVELAKILLKHHWKVQPKLIHAKKDYENKIKKTTAGLIIGDRCIEYGMQFEYEYDLGDAWKQMTGLPFVFAAWISNKLLSVDFIERFNLALKKGVSRRNYLAEKLQKDYNAAFNVKDYFKNNISYRLDEEKKKGMELFLNYMKEEDRK